MSKNFFKNSKNVKELSPKDFDPVATWTLKNKDLCVVLFYVDWCPHCQKMKDEYEKFAEMAAFINVYAFNCENNKSHVLKIKEDAPELVKGYPTIVFYKNGKPLEQYVSPDRTASKFLEAAMRICKDTSKARKK
jgi:protein disulfide-isomerase A6